MTIVIRPAASRRWASAATLLALAIAIPVSACGSSGSTTASAASATAAQATCAQVDAALSNGPDPDADPVGYAEAQIQPLRQIHTADAALDSAIGALADAYSGFYTANGKGGAATSALTAAVKKINSLCPGLGASA